MNENKLANIQQDLNHFQVPNETDEEQVFCSKKQKKILKKTCLKIHRETMSQKMKKKYHYN